MKSALLCILGAAAINAASFTYYAQEQEKAPTKVGACVWRACQEKVRHTNAHILLVKYNEITVGHAYCLFVEKGHRYANDWRGNILIDGAPENALQLASVLPPPIDGLTVATAEIDL